MEMKFQSTLVKVHLWSGVIGIIIFVGTGQYMLHIYNHLDGMADGPRLLFRSGHIYVLLAFLINLMIGVFYHPASLPRYPKLQLLASALILLAPLLYLAGFFIEPPVNDLVRHLSKSGTFALFLAAILLIYIKYRNR